MIRLAMAATIAAALAAAPVAAQVQSPNYPPAGTVEPPPRDQTGTTDQTGAVVGGIIRDALQAAAARAEEKRRRRALREWQRQQQLQQQQQQQATPVPPVVAAPVPEPSSPADPQLNPAPVPIKAAKPAPTKRPARVKPVPVATHVAHPVARPDVPAPVPVAIPAPIAVAQPSPELPASKPAPAAIETRSCADGSVVALTAACPRKPSPLSRWWPLALLGFGAAAAAAGWWVRQRRIRLARTRAALSLKPRLDQDAGGSSSSPLHLAAPRVSIRARLELA